MPRPVNSPSTMPDSVRTLTAAVMFIRPENKIPKPIAIFPICRELLSRPPMIMIMPIISAMGAKDDGLKSCSQEVAPPPVSRSRSLMIWPVTVVPTLAPIMIPMDW